MFYEVCTLPSKNISVLFLVFELDGRKCMNFINLAVHYVLIPNYIIMPRGRRGIFRVGRKTRWRLNAIVHVYILAVDDIRGILTLCLRSRQRDRPFYLIVPALVI